MIAGAGVVRASSVQRDQPNRKNRGVQESAISGRAVSIPVSASTAFITFTPVVLPVTGRSVELELKISVPTSEETFQSSCCPTVTEIRITSLH